MIDRGVRQYLDAPGAAKPAEVLGEPDAVQLRQQLPTALDQGDLQASRAQRRRHLDAGQSAADHEQAPLVDGIGAQRHRVVDIVQVMDACQ